MEASRELDATARRVGQLRSARSARLAHLEAQLIAARRTPQQLTRLVEKIDASARDRLRALRSALGDQRDLREVFLVLFLTPARTADGGRQVWRIEGAVNLRTVVDQIGPDCVATPTGQDAIGTIAVDILVVRPRLLR